MLCADVAYPKRSRPNTKRCSGSLRTLVSFRPFRSPGRLPTEGCSMTKIPISPLPVNQTVTKIPVSQFRIATSARTRDWLLVMTVITRTPIRTALFGSLRPQPLTAGVTLLATPVQEKNILRVDRSLAGAVNSWEGPYRLDALLHTANLCLPKI